MRTSQLVYLIVEVWASRWLGSLQLWSEIWGNIKLFNVDDDVAQGEDIPLRR